MFNTNIEYNAVNSLLAKGIPALSYATGNNHVNIFVDQNGDRNINMANLKRNTWPRNHPQFGDRWLHCDIREMAYLYTYKAFDEMVEKGGLK